MKKIISAAAASALMSVAGLASAAEPMQLSDNQMDTVSAGAISIAAGGAGALLGTVISNTSSGTAIVLTPVSLSAITSANSFNFGSGLLVFAGSEAAAEL